LVSNLPQLQAAGHVDTEGRLVKAVVVRRLPTLPAPRHGAPKPLVRVLLRCRRCACGAPTRYRDVCVGTQVSVRLIDVGVAVEEERYERDAATGMRGEWGRCGRGRGGCCYVSCHSGCGRVCVAAQCGSNLQAPQSTPQR
jgi:hypothetical protein